MSNCQKCRFCESDYERDEEEEDEIEVFSCTKVDIRKYIDKDIDCPYFKEYKPKKYIEKDTECDKCQNLRECIKNSQVIENTTSYDCKSHYIKGFMSCSKN